MQKYEFECQRCGFCCKGETTVSLSESDQIRMLNELGIESEVALKKYWRETGNVIQMKTKDGYCIFYKSGCTVHKGRPEKCREWPLVEAILYDEKNYETIKASCPALQKDGTLEDVKRIIKKK